MKAKMSFLRCLLSSVAIVGTAVPMVAQDFTIHMKADNGVEGTTYYVSPKAIRRTTPGISDVIDRIDRGTIIFINHRNKTYGEVPAAEAREKIASSMANLDPQKKALMHQMGLDAPTQLTKIGPGENIAGLPTEQYSLTTGMARGELWITQALQFPAAYYRDFNLLSGVSLPIGDAGKVAEVHGVVLKRKMTGLMGRNTSSGAGETAVSVERGQVPAAMFEPPPGYQKSTERSSER